jgi:hypothetical protein
MALAVQSAALKSDNLRIQTNPSLSGLVAYQDRFCLYDSALVVGKSRHFGDFSVLRVSDLRTVNCSENASMMNGKRRCTLIIKGIVEAGD